MADLKSSPLLALKGRFRAPNLRYYSQFLILINQKSSFIEVAAIVVTTYSETFNLNPSESWKTFEAGINRAKYENKFSQSITLELQGQFKALTIDKAFLTDMLKAIHSNKPENINFLLSGIFRRAIRDEEFKVDTHVEPVSLEDQRQDNEAIDPTEDLKSSEIYVPIKFDLDPITGTNVQELKIDDYIMIRILPENTRANALIEQLGLRNDNGIIRTIPMGITSLNRIGGALELIGKINENTLGKILEEQNVLVRMYEAPKIKETKKNNGSQIQASKQRNLSEGKRSQLILIGAIVGGLLVAALAYLISIM